MTISGLSKSSIVRDLSRVVPKLGSSQTGLVGVRKELSHTIEGCWSSDDEILVETSVVT